MYQYEYNKYDSRLGEIVHHVSRPHTLCRRQVYSDIYANYRDYKFIYGMNMQDDMQISLRYYVTRYYNPRYSICLSVDPHYFNYPTLTPYAYVANNPVNLIDPDGRDIYVTGEGAEDFVSSLQARTKLNVVRDESTGRISFEGKAKKKMDKLLVSISEDDNVDVIIDAVKNTDYVPGTDGDGRFSGGLILELA